VGKILKVSYACYVMQTCSFNFVTDKYMILNVASRTEAMSFETTAEWDWNSKLNVELHASIKGDCSLLLTRICTYKI